MSDSESAFGSELNAFDGESSDWDTSSEAASLEAEGGEDTDVEILGEEVNSIPTHGIGKGLMTGQPLPLAAVYKDGTRAGTFEHQPEASTSGRGEGVAGPSQPRVTIIHRERSRIPVGVPKKTLFGVDYLEPNKITERELERIRAEYLILDSVKMRIPSRTESLSDPRNGEVTFFTDVLLKGVQLPLQPTVQKILAQIWYAPGQYNPNFWVALMGVIAAFVITEEREPSYEQFSYLYSITKSKSADHGGWVQANPYQVLFQISISSFKNPNPLV
ncbi:hypothetical protein L3X38_039655 [Prunus dulcis]|uniref:Uncharacterized protein n=1 Tax=Prunus dulcis TaxID=3755 RepID=A0AAD4V925_PRUDU|nr:hypothetical protein L3X38_039655 [Prunus dulcis]